MTGVVLFAHGSQVEAANEAVRAVTAKLARQAAVDLAETAFLDCAPPALADAIEGLVARGAKRVLVIPYFLTLGIHLQRDLPALVAQAQEQHPGLSIEVTEPLDGHPKLVDIVVDRAAKALNGSRHHTSPTD